MRQGYVTSFSVILLTALTLSTQARAETHPAVPGQYIVKVKGTKLFASTGAKQIMGARVLESISPDLGLVLVERPIVETAASVVATLSQDPSIEYVEPNYIYSVVGTEVSMPAEPDFGRLWGLKNEGQVTSGDQGSITGTAGIDIGAIEAWKIQTGSRDVVVAVIDTGVDYRNPDLAANIFINEAEANGVAGVDDDGNGYVDDVHGYDFAYNDADPMDDFGHGTHVAGTIGADASNGTGIVGVAWKVSILPVRFLDSRGSGTLANALKSVDYATKMRVTIMNNSWGGGPFSQALLDSIVKAKDQGILFVAAAGNNGSNNDKTQFYPANYQVDNVVSVGAVAPTGRLASFSNYGLTTVHVSAPGVNILSHNTQGLAAWSGTSMAAPHVAGIAALLYSHEPLTYLQVKDRIMRTGLPIPTHSGRTITGRIASAHYALLNTPPPENADDPSKWPKDMQSVSTEHPYPNATKREWTFKVPGATRVALHFSKFETEAQYDVVEFRDSTGKSLGTLSGEASNSFSPVAEGDTIVMSLTSDGSVNKYGFDVTGVAYK